MNTDIILDEIDKEFIQNLLKENQKLKQSDEENKKLILQNNQRILEFLKIEFLRTGFQYKNCASFIENLLKNQIDLISNSHDVIGNYRSEADNSDNDNLIDGNNSKSTRMSNYIQISHFRRALIKNTVDDITVMKWNISSEIIKPKLIASLFNGNDFIFNNFLDEQIMNLNYFRSYIYAYKDKCGILDEVTMFQPLYQLFIGEMASKLNSLSPNSTNNSSSNINSDLSVRNINRCRLKTASIKCNIDNKVVTKSLSGSSDLGVVIDIISTNLIISFVVAIMLLSIIELKTPFTHLYKRNPIAQRDQLLGQVMSLHHMKGDRNDVLNKYTLGCLTDMFTLNLIIKPNKSDNKFYCTNHVIDDRDYVMYLLMMFCRFSDDDIDSLLQSSTDVIPIDESVHVDIVNDDDDYNNEEQGIVAIAPDDINQDINNLVINCAVGHSYNDSNKRKREDTDHELDWLYELEDDDYNDDIDSFDEEDERFENNERLYYERKSGYYLDAEILRQYLDTMNEKTD